MLPSIAETTGKLSDKRVGVTRARSSSMMMITLYEEDGLVGRDPGHDRHVGDLAGLEERPGIGRQEYLLSHVDLDGRQKHADAAVHGVLQCNRNRG